MGRSGNFGKSGREGYHAPPIDLYRRHVSKTFYMDYKKYLHTCHTKFFVNEGLMSWHTISR